VVAARFLVTGIWRPGQLLHAATTPAQPLRCCASRGGTTARKPHASPLERLSSGQRSRRVARRHARPVVVLSAPVESADRSVVGAEVLKGPQHPLGWASGRQQHVRRGPVLARSTAAGEACRGW
jgi:hypothetical protein